MGSENQEKMKIIGLSKIICRVIGFIFIITFVREPNDSWIVLAGYTLTSCLICAYLFYKSLKDIKTLKLPSFQEIKVLLSESSNSFLITFFPIIYQTLSMVLLSIFVNPTQFNQKKDFQAILTANNEMNELVNNLKKDLEDLDKRFNKKNRDFGKLAIEKTKAIERIMNKGGDNAARCIEIASGSPLTEKEINATKKSEINPECPSIANPNYVPY